MKTIFKLENATVNDIISEELETLLKLHNNIEHVMEEYKTYSKKSNKHRLIKLNIPECLSMDLIYGALLLFDKETFIDVSMLEYLERSYRTTSKKLYEDADTKTVIENFYNNVFQNLPESRTNKPIYLHQLYEACAYIHKLSDITFVLGGDFAFNIPNCLLIMLSDPEAANRLMNPYNNSHDFFGEFDEIYYRGAEILSEETKGEVIQKRFKEMLNAHVDKLTPAAVCKV